MTDTQANINIPQNAQPSMMANARVDNDEINLIEVFKLLAKERRLIFAVTAVFFIGALIYAITTPNMYRATVTLFPVDESSNGMGALSSQFSGLASLAGINLGSKGDKTQNYIEILKSRQFITRFIEKHDLKKILFSKSWDNDNNTWLEPQGPLHKVKNVLFDITKTDFMPTDLQAFSKFSHKVMSVSQNKKTSVVSIGITWLEPQIAANWANTLVERINEQIRTDKIERAKKSLAYLEYELKRTTNFEMKNVLYGLMEAQTQSIMLSNVSEEAAFRLLDPAVAPEGKSSPKRVLFLVLGVLFGLMVGVFIVIVRNASSPNRGDL